MLHFALAPRTFHFRKPAATSRGPLTQRAALLVEVRALDNGPAVGLGECGPIPGLSPEPDGWQIAAQKIIDALNRASLTLPPASANPLAVCHLLDGFADQLAALPALRFGLESALLDLVGGGTGLLFDTPFVRGETALATHGLLWMDDVDGLLAQAEAKVAQGYGVLKLKVGALPWVQEWPLLETLRRRYPQVALRLDANGAFTPTVALDRLRQIASLGVEFVEQPIAPGHQIDLQQLVSRSPVAIGLDEELIALSQDDRLRLLETLAAATLLPPVVILKPTLLGGFGAATALAHASSAVGLPWIVNSLLEAAPGHSAICQWTSWLLAQQPPAARRIHGLGAGTLYADNLPSPITLDGATMRWTC